MRYSIKTADDKYWIGVTGNFITKYKIERALYNNKSFAQWYVDNTNMFGKLKIVRNIK